MNVLGALTGGEVALVSAAVAALVSLAVGVLTFVATVRGHRAENDRLERELQRTMTVKLYDRRMESYPKVWKTTDGLRRSQMIANDARSNPEHFRRLLADLDEWTAGDGAMILSKESVEASHEVRQALRDSPADGTNYSEAQIERAWQAKRRFRQELRRDVELLFNEDGGRRLKPVSTDADQ